MTKGGENRSLEIVGRGGSFIPEESNASGVLVSLTKDHREKTPNLFGGREALSMEEVRKARRNKMTVGHRDNIEGFFLAAGRRRQRKSLRTERGAGAKKSPKLKDVRRTGVTRHSKNII